jgi:hypothetical protein
MRLSTQAGLIKCANGCTVSISFCANAVQNICATPLFFQKTDSRFVPCIGTIVQFTVSVQGHILCMSSSGGGLFGRPATH